FAELVAMKASAFMKDRGMASGVINGNEFNQQGEFHEQSTRYF
ncbi:hypothetical protein ACN58J_005264, partial [Escherichia coli]